MTHRIGTLAADVSLPGGTWQDGPRVDLDVGAWLLLGVAQVGNPGNDNQGAGITASARLSNGNDTYAQADRSAFQNYFLPVPVAALVDLVTPTSIWLKASFGPDPGTTGLEVGITIGDTGSYELRVNGNSVGWIPPASGDTKPGADTTVNKFDVQAQTGSINSGPNADAYFDDFAVDSAGFIGEGVITLLSPNGAGATTQLTPTGAPNNWQNVDEVPPSDADFNEATAANLKDTYTHAALPATAGSVGAALLAARVVKVGSSINNAYLVVRSGATDYESPANLMSLSPSIITGMWETDPAGGAWTPTSLNASQIGIRFDA